MSKIQRVDLILRYQGILVSMFIFSFVIALVSLN
jgi:hypothetical protein